MLCGMNRILCGNTVNGGKLFLSYSMGDANTEYQIHCMCFAQCFQFEKCVFLWVWVNWHLFILLILHCL